MCCGFAPKNPSSAAGRAKFQHPVWSVEPRATVVQLSIGPEGLIHSPDSPALLGWQQLFARVAVAVKAKMPWTSARSTRASSSDGAARCGACSGTRLRCVRTAELRKETGDRMGQTRTAQAVEYKETGLATIETNRREPLADVGCICGRARVCADASLENWRRGGLTMDQPADVVRAYEQRTHGAREGEGDGRAQGPWGGYNLARTEREARQGEAVASAIRHILEGELPRVCRSRILPLTQATCT